MTSPLRKKTNQTIGFEDNVQWHQINDNDLSTLCRFTEHRNGLFSISF
ncbi:hypothetical protein [Arenibacter sp. N53]|nr:hypothetical protein [Arenibacter sp. N53]